MAIKSGLSWQGIGISSNPFQRDEPLSVHFQAYLEEAAQSADEHVIIIADEMQIPNYQTLHGLSYFKARKVASKKGRTRQKNLERILSSRGINNVRVLRFREIYGEQQKTIVSRIERLFDNDPEVRDAILRCVPKRLVEKAKDKKEIAQYALTEVGLILSMPGVKFGHERERVYDDTALMINKKYGIGNAPSFIYSQKGLEFLPDRNIDVEPYSSLVSEDRLLLTDSQRDFERKVGVLEGKDARKVLSQLGKDGMYKGESLSNFYGRQVRPTKRALDAPRRRVRGIAGSIAASILALVSAGAYMNRGAEAIRQNHMSQISIFGLNGDMNTCIKANKDALTNANQEIQNKYHIKDYFRS